MPDIDALNALPDDQIHADLLRCCGCVRWADAMVRDRPFRDREHLFAQASERWRALGPPEWLEAFAHHPRIGEVKAVPTVAQSTAAWAAGEQAAAQRASDEVRAALAAGNRAYEARYGHVYLVCATGRSADELLAVLRARMDNTPEDELRVAAAEQEKITRIRLEKLLSSP